MTHRSLPALALALGLALALTLTASALEVGETAPDWTLKNIRTDESITLSSLRGKHVLLDFWATWCGPCRYAMSRELNPLWQQFGERTGDWTLISVGVPSRNDSADRQRRYADENDYSWTFVHDPTGSVSNAYGVRGIPTMVMIDPEGIIRGLDHHGVGLQMARILDPTVDSLSPARADISEGAEPFPASGSAEATLEQGGEAVFSFTAGQAGTHVFETTGQMDTTLQVLSDAGRVLGENDDADSSTLNSRVDVDLEEGQDCYVAVKGYAGQAGTFGITITRQ